MHIYFLLARTDHNFYSLKKKKKKYCSQQFIFWSSMGSCSASRCLMVATEEHGAEFMFEVVLNQVRISFITLFDSQKHVIMKNLITFNTFLLVYLNVYQSAKRCCVPCSIFTAPFFIFIFLLNFFLLGSINVKLLQSGSLQFNTSSKHNIRTATKRS